MTNKEQLEVELDIYMDRRKELLKQKRDLDIEIHENLQQIQKINEKLGNKNKKIETNDAVHILRIAECLENVDDDIAEMVLSSIEQYDKISIADLMEEMQKVKNKLKEEVHKKWQTSTRNS